jgi:hypothetical protein
MKIIWACGVCSRYKRRFAFCGGIKDINNFPVWPEGASKPFQSLLLPRRARRREQIPADQSERSGMAGVHGVRA